MVSLNYTLCRRYVQYKHGVLYSIDVYVRKRLFIVLFRIIHLGNNEVGSYTFCVVTKSEGRCWNRRKSFHTTIGYKTENSGRHTVHLKVHELWKSEIGDKRDEYRQKKKKNSTDHLGRDTNWAFERQEVYLVSPESHT